MNPQDLDPLRGGRERDSIRAGLPRCRGLAADEPLPRGPDEERGTEAVKEAEMREQGKIVGGGLAEADAGVDGDAGTRDAGALRRFDTRFEIVIDLEDDVL